MVNTTINFRTDSEVKCESEAIFEKLGISMSAALNMFLHQVVIQGGIPFEVTTRTPNMETLKAMDEANMIAKDPSRKRFDSVEELFEELRS